MGFPVNYALVQPWTQAPLSLYNVQDYSELDKLQPLRGLLELSLLDNPLSRRHQHRAITIFNLPALLSLDGVRVTSQERQNAEAIFSITEEQVIIQEVIFIYIHVVPNIG